jgi:sterol desaturase/sphingolipid hydroxylase (fatty acid hydroxylase superfamily)
VDQALVALALPFFAIMIAVEVFLSRRASDPHYRFIDSITDLSCGVGSQALEPFLRTAGLAGYFWLFEHFRVATIPTSSVVGWGALVVGVDFFYYVFHRASHRVNFLWALHVVHHQSEEYNLAVALRQSWFELLFEGVFYVPLAVVGFSPVAFVTVSTLNTLYQFWIHTRLVPKLPRWIESWLNTPSHHRVHHGVNPKYIDKNYAGMFIVWDRWLGTFEEEQEEPVYGTVKPLASFNPLWANFEYWAEMASLSAKAPRLLDKVRAWVAPPEWRPRELSGGLGYVTIPEVTRATRARYDVVAPKGVYAYVTVHFAAVLAISSLGMVFGERLPSAVSMVTTLLVLTEVVAWGGLFESRAWGTTLAVVRSVATAAAVAWFAHGAAAGSMPALVVGAVSVIECAWVLRLPRVAPAGESPVAAVVAR